MQHCDHSCRSVEQSLYKSRIPNAAAAAKTNEKNAAFENPKSFMTIMSFLLNYAISTHNNIYN